VIQFFYHESTGTGMRGGFVDQCGLFSYIAPEVRVPVNHPLRKIRELVRNVLGELNRSLGKLYASEGLGGSLFSGSCRKSLILLQGGTSPSAVALKAIDNPHSDCSAIRRFKVQTAIRARQHRSRHLRAYFLCDDLNLAVSAVHWPPR